MDLVRVLITGPVDTPYSRGCFVFDVYYPSTFPANPPIVIMITTGGGTVRYVSTGLLVASYPSPTQKIGKGTWCHLQTFPYVLCWHVMQQLHALRDHVVASYCCRE